MKRSFNVFLMSAILLAACNKVSYKKTGSGLAYKVYPGKGKDSLIKVGDVVKFNYSVKYNDSLMETFTSYGKMPGYMKVQDLAGKPSYDFREVLLQLKRGDSLVTIQMADTLLATGSPLLPPNAKKGDRVITGMRILEVFTSDSIAMDDYNKEVALDKPRQLKEQQEANRKTAKDREDAFNKSYDEWKKSGEVDRQIHAMETFLSGRKINAQMTGKGTFVLIKEQGTGPAAAKEKYLLVKYNGTFLERDSTFDSGEYPLQLGYHSVIPGWEEGLLLFKEGGKGTIFVPGFLAYGTNPPPNSPFRQHEPMKFEIELLKVSDTAIAPPGH